MHGPPPRSRSACPPDTGAEEAPPPEVAAAHRDLAAAGCRAVLGRLDHRDAPEGFAEGMAGDGSRSELVGHVDRAG